MYAVRNFKFGTVDNFFLHCRTNGELSAANTVLPVTDCVGPNNIRMLVTNHYSTDI